MGKKRKIFLSFLLCILMTFTTSMPVSAQPVANEDIESDATMYSVIDIENYSNEIMLGKKVVLPDGAVLTPISKDEYVSRLAKEKNISIEEAYELESADNSMSRSTSIESYIDYSKDFTYPGNSSFKSTLLATLKIKTWQGGAVQIQNVLSVSSQRKSGLYLYDWVQTDAFSDPTENGSGFPVTKAVLTAKGYFTVEVDTSVTGTVKLLGFSIDVTVGTVIKYISNNTVLRDTVNLYP